MAEEILKKPGDILFNKLVLFSPNQNKYINLDDYLVEINIYENMLSSVMSGSITLADSRNLIKDFPLIGEEILYVDVKTPTFDPENNLDKIFRVYSITDKSYSSDGATIIYQLNFTSLESFRSLYSPISRSFQGKPEEIISQIYKEYLQIDKGIELTILTPTANTIKFVSPGWTPLECINWICSKSLPVNNTSANFLFWETSSGFYFGSTDTIFKDIENYSIGEYVYSQSYINTLKRDDIQKSMMAIKSLNIERSFDQLTNSMSGYIANRVLDIDLYNKQYSIVDYDHGKKFNNYSHTEVDPVVPLFDITTDRNPLTFLTLNYSHSKLHNDNPDNFDVQTKNIFGNRRSNLLELDNFKMNLVVPGRTDIQAGATINIKMPSGTLTYSEDKVNNNEDELYTGNYLITNLCHKINPSTHFISMTVTKNSFLSNKFGNTIK